MSLLAGCDPANPNPTWMARAQELAYDLILTQEQIDLYTTDGTDLNALIGGRAAWPTGFKLLALAEYYLHTGDSAVYDSMRAYAIACANGQSMFGTSGHQFSVGGPTGPYAVGYGVVNSGNMQCFYGLTLAKEAGVTDQRVLDAIERSSRFYAGYVDRGAIPYGENLAESKQHESNGKSGIAALAMRMVGTRDDEAKFYAQMAGASAEWIREWRM